MNKSKIEWTDSTWNPVWGCINNCSYCYARKMAKRFAEKVAMKESKYNTLNKYDQFVKIRNFEPTWIYSNFIKSFPKKPSRIFVNSMSDIAYWKQEWMQRVLDKIKEYPQHTFLFLTKKFEIYFNDFSDNCWLGVTVTNQKQMDNLGCVVSSHKLFLSIEPIQERIKLNPDFKTDWVIVGSETGNRKDKVIPEFSWLLDLRTYTLKNKIPFFMKNSLKSIYHANLIQEFPE